jgi:hypothetical protein
LFPNLKKKEKSMFTNSLDPNCIISGPVGKVSVLDGLMDQIELLNLELLDQRDGATNYKTIHDNLVLRTQELETQLAVKNTEKYEHSQLQQRNVQLEADLKTEVGNRDHFRALITQQDAYIQELKKQSEQEKAIKKQEIDDFQVRLDTKTKEADHLAKKAVELTQQLATVASENDSFRQRNNSLLEENRKLYDKSRELECDGCRTGEMGAYCGGCLGCKSRQDGYTIWQLNEKLKLSKETNAIRYNIINLYRQMHGIFVEYLETQAKHWFGGAAAASVLERTGTICIEIAKLHDSNKTPKVWDGTPEKNVNVVITPPSKNNDSVVQPPPFPINRDNKSLKSPPLS